MHVVRNFELLGTLRKLAKPIHFGGFVGAELSKIAGGSRGTVWSECGRLCRTAAIQFAMRIAQVHEDWRRGNGPG
jgi:hypothetical protein